MASSYDSGFEEEDRLTTSEIISAYTIAPPPPTSANCDVDARLSEAMSMYDKASRVEQSFIDTMMNGNQKKQVETWNKVSREVSRRRGMRRDTKTSRENFTRFSYHQLLQLEDRFTDLLGLQLRECLPDMSTDLIDDQRKALYREVSEEVGRRHALGIESSKAKSGEAYDETILYSEPSKLIGPDVIGEPQLWWLQERLAGQVGTMLEDLMKLTDISKGDPSALRLIHGQVNEELNRRTYLIEYADRTEGYSELGPTTRTPDTIFGPHRVSKVELAKFQCQLAELVPGKTLEELKSAWEAEVRVLYSRHKKADPDGEYRSLTIQLKNRDRVRRADAVSVRPGALGPHEDTEYGPSVVSRAVLEEYGKYLQEQAKLLRDEGSFQRW